MSLATDAATEAVYPLLPFFLTTVLGAGALSLGLIEGAAEAANSGLKVLSGRLADRAPAKRPLVIAGYALSSLIRPLIAIAASWVHVLSIRIVDRLGKGIRSAPRDALLAGWATSTTRGRVFGFHRAMDHAGAVVGPLAATAFLYFYPGGYRLLFALTIIPGAIAVALLFLVREDGDSRPSTRESRPATDDSRLETSDSILPPVFWRYMAVLALFTLGNSTDAFLLLRLTDAAGGATYVPLMWAGLHVIKAVSSMVGGAWSDRMGRREVIGLGWMVYAAVYAGFAASDTLTPLLVWFFVYGLYFGLTEGTEKALVADLAPVPRRGLAFGIYSAVLGIGALAASVAFGAIWSVLGSAAAFGTGAVLSLVATVLLFALVRVGPVQARPL